MPTYIALLRAVNVGVTGKLPMTELKAMCEAAGFTRVQTYIASGNVVFSAKSNAREVQAALESRLQNYASKPVGVVIRAAAEMRAVLNANPYPDAPANHVIVHFLNEAPPADALDHLKGQQHEKLQLGEREIYSHYPLGQGSSKLVIPAAKIGTGRNMNTVRRLVELASELDK